MVNKLHSIYAQIALSSWNIGVHTVCSLLLLNIYRKNDGPGVQQLYLLNLSAVELIKNLFFLVFCVSIVVEFQLPHTIMWLCYSCIDLIFILVMTIITADRLIASLLNLQYAGTFTPFRAKITIFCAWFVSFILTPSMFGILYAAHGFTALDDAVSYTHKFIFPTLYVLYIVFASITYLIMFMIFVRSRRRSSYAQQSAFQLFTHSKFYVALLLIASFLLFSVIPMLIKSGMRLKIIAQNQNVDNVMNICFYISDTADGIIYILFYPPVRNILRKVLCKFCDTPLQEQGSTVAA